MNPKDTVSMKILDTKYLCSKKFWVQDILGERFTFKIIWAPKLEDPKIFWVQVYFESSQTPSLYPPNTLYTLQTPFTHLLGTLHTPLRHPPNFSLLYCMKVLFPTRAGAGGWLVPLAESCHFVVQLARLQDFKQG